MGAGCCGSGEAPALEEEPSPRDPRAMAYQADDQYPRKSRGRPNYQAAEQERQKYNKQRKQRGRKSNAQCNTSATDSEDVWIPPNQKAEQVRFGDRNKVNEQPADETVYETSDCSVEFPAQMWEIAMLRKLPVHVNLAKLTAALSHPGSGSTLLWTARRYGWAQPLCPLNARPMKLNNAKLARVAAGMAAGLACLHRQGLVHGRIRGDRVLIGPSGEPQLCMLGRDLAEHLRAPYRAPELILETHEPYLPAADLWSMGVVLWHASFGALPFGRSGGPKRGDNLVNKLGGDSAHEAMVESVLHSDPTPPDKNVNTTHLSFLLAILDKQPEFRVSASDCLQSEWIVSHRAAPMDREWTTSSAASPSLSRLLSVRDITRAITPSHAYPELMGELGRSGESGVLNVPFKGAVDYKTGVFNASLKQNAPASSKKRERTANWSCPACTLENYGGQQCEVCGTARPTESEVKAVDWLTAPQDQDINDANIYKAPAKLPELVHLSPKHCDVKSMTGPTAHCNWVIPGRLLQGSHPGVHDELESELVCLVGTGVTRFVSCATSNEMLSLGMYNKAAQIVASHINTKTCSGRNATLTRLQFNQLQSWEIDQRAPEQELSTLTKELVRCLEGRDVIYVHCTQGNGRSGMLCALILAQLYSLNSYDTLDRINRYHSSRGGNNDASGYFSSRLSHSMVAQLHEMVADLPAQHDGLKEPLMQPGATRSGELLESTKHELSIALQSMSAAQMSSFLDSVKGGTEASNSTASKRRDSLDCELDSLQAADDSSKDASDLVDTSGPMSMSEGFFKKFMDSGR